MGQDSGGSTAHGYKTIVYIICMVAALGGLLFGLDQGFIANSLATLTQHYKFGVEGGESYSAILATGGIFGALLSGSSRGSLGARKAWCSPASFSLQPPRSRRCFRRFPSCLFAALHWDSESESHPSLFPSIFPKQHLPPSAVPWERSFS